MSTTTENSSDAIRRDNNQYDETNSPERLEREVDQARSQLGRTASELSDRLSPSDLIDQAISMAREHGGEFGRNLSTQVKNNPLPLILTGVGLSWMMMSSGNKSSAYAKTSHNMSTNKDGHGFKDALGNITEKSRDKASAVGESVHDASSNAKESVHNATANAKESMQNAQESMVRFYRDQPLLAGGLGIAIGAVLGALVPPTEMEDDMMGKTRDRSVDAAKSKVVDKYDEVRESARAE